MILDKNGYYRSFFFFLSDFNLPPFQKQISAKIISYKYYCGEKLSKWFLFLFLKGLDLGLVIHSLSKGKTMVTY